MKHSLELIAPGLIVPPEQNLGVRRIDIDVLRTNKVETFVGIMSGEPPGPAGPIALTRTLDLIDEILGSESFGVATLKGLVARQWYEQPVLRRLGDIDIAARSFSDASRLAEQLLKRGWDFDATELPWVKFTADGVAYGVINMEPPNYADHYRVDIHFGDYSVRAAAHHPLRWSAHEQKGIVDINAEDAWICIVANAAGDCRILAKDINDALLFFGTMNPNLEPVEDAIKRLDLQRFLAAMLKALSWLYPDEKSPLVYATCNGLRRMTRSHTPEDVALFANCKASVRAKIVTAHSRKAARADSGMIEGDVVAHVESYYSASDLSVYPRADEIRPSPCIPSQYQCVRLAPLDRVRDAVHDDYPATSSSLEDRAAWQQGRDLIIGARTLRPTIWGDVPLRPGSDAG